jgi:hypothetical protein
MNDTKRQSDEANSMILEGIEVHSDMEHDDNFANGHLNSALWPIFEKWGAREVLAAIHDAAYASAEVHGSDEDPTVDPESIGRVKIFCARLRQAMETLK